MKLGTQDISAINLGTNEVTKAYLGTDEVWSAGGFLPTDITGLKLWMKSDSLSLADNDPVSTWSDSSGLGNDLTAAGSARPTYKTNIQNSLPVVRFNGTDNVLSGIFTITYGSAFVVCNNGSGATFPEYSGLLITENGAGNSNIFFSGEAATSNFYQASAAFPFRLKIYMNGVNTLVFSPLSTMKVVSGVGGTGVAPISKTSLAIGNNASAGGRFWNGDICEILVYDTALSDADRGLVEGYLITKYAI